ncbi:protein kinase domain-containing protein [Phlyctema vagabunda]|uniref:Protein kinase domain-containing protein n=1 Tax=Phlyctema vagabunda TaxID=108571 RepID=A0ABR4PCW8_9HELO
MVKVRTLFQDFDEEEIIDIPPSSTTDQVYDYIQNTKQFAEDYCKINLTDKELSLAEGNCLIYCKTETRDSHPQLQESYPLRNLDDWGTIEAVVANHARTGHTDILINITRKLELGSKRITMPDSRNIWLWKDLARGTKSTLDKSCVYIPKAHLEQLITSEVVTSVVQEDNNLSIPIENVEDRKALADEIYHRSHILFASVVYERLSFKLLERLVGDKSMELNDSPLPSEYPHWLDDEDLQLEYNKLYHGQWLCRAAVFNIAGKHQDFNEKVVVPYLSKEQFDHGAFSVLYKVRIEASHQTIYEIPDEKNPELALKVITDRRNVGQAFRNEQLILRGLRDIYHDHIIQILGSYRQNGQYHFLFPLADCNLERYMGEAPPGFQFPESQESREFIAWMWSQLEGIASGLSTIHNNPHEVTRQDGLSSINNEAKDVKELKILDVKVQDDKTPATGYHHDIKPQNILHFKKNKIRRIKTSVPEHGILQIADFGIGKFHSEKSGTGTRTFRGTATYAAPESKIPREQNTKDGIEPTSGLKVSRSYDIWSFGCVIMEVIVWLLYSANGRRTFMNERQGPAVEGDHSLENDAFFYVTSPQNPIQKEARLRPEVLNWIEKLYGHQRIRDNPDGSLARGLKLVQDILNLDPSTRINARGVERVLGQITLIAKGECNTLDIIQKSRANQRDSPIRASSPITPPPTFNVQSPRDVDRTIDGSSMASGTLIVESPRTSNDSLVNTRTPLCHPEFPRSPGTAVQRTDTAQTSTSMSSLKVERFDSHPQ